MFIKFKELTPKIDFSSFEYSGIVEQLYEVFKLLAQQLKKVDVL